MPDQIHELILVGAADPLVPNVERIVLRPTQQLDLGDYLLLLGVRTPEGGVRPFDVFAFGTNVVAPPSWILVFTGSGQTGVGKWEKTGEQVLSLFMGRASTILFPGVVPVLVRMGAAAFGPPVPPAPAIPPMPAISKPTTG